MWGALSLYITVRMVALPDFPIYFFTDEAVQTVQASDLILHNFRSPQGELLPTYFQNGPFYNLSLSVYAQVLPVFLFGKSIWVTRGAAALMTLLAAVSVGLILDRVFKSRYAWLGVLLLSITPAWFLHSRTAFETTLAASFFAAFLCCYLMYVSHSPHWLYGAVFFGALAFYTYTPMRIVMLVCAGLLFLTDLRLHMRRRKTLLGAFLLVCLLALPFVRFLLLHPGDMGRHLQVLGSYWISDISLAAKLGTFLREYLRGLSPLYWYIPNDWDLVRHTMRGYGHLLWPLLPLGLLGIYIALRRIRQAPYRVLLIAALAAPSGAAFVRLGITRALVMVIPVTILTALAAQAVLEWLRSRVKISPLLIFLPLAVANLLMLHDALRNGPTWYEDYGLTGMQYGARQVFTEVADHLRAHPEDQIVLSPSWSNGTDVVARFFFPVPLPFELGSPRAFFDASRPLTENTLVVMLPDEFDSLPQERFAKVEIEKVVPFPDGRPGFYFTRLAYIDNVKQVVALEREEHYRPQNSRITLDGQEVNVTHPRLDIGTVEAVFDRLLDTMIRTQAINPLDLTLDFAAPRVVQGITLRVGGPATDITVRASTGDGAAPVELTRSLPQSTQVREAVIDFSQPLNITRLDLSIANAGEPPDAFVHLWEVTLR